MCDRWPCEDMANKLLIDQGFRVYAIALLVVGVFTGLWGTGIVTLEPTTIGYVWIAMAVIGASVAVAVVANRDHALVNDMATERRETFIDNPLTDTPLHIYFGLLGFLSVSTAGLLALGLGNTAITLVGYGWVAAAGYGVVLTLGLVVTHANSVKKAASVTESLEA